MLALSRASVPRALMPSTPIPRPFAPAGLDPGRDGVVCASCRGGRVRREDGAPAGGAGPTSRRRGIRLIAGGSRIPACPGGSHSSGAKRGPACRRAFERGIRHAATPSSSGPGRSPLPLTALSPERITAPAPIPPPYQGRLDRTRARGVYSRPLGEADDGTRTRYLELGKLALYQVSYIRVAAHSTATRTDDRGEAARQTSRRLACVSTLSRWRRGRRLRWSA
jgi:hypothetical protein